MAVTISGSGPIAGVTTLASPTTINGLTVPTDSLQPGLVLVSPTSIANSGGSASLSGAAVSFSSANSVSLNGVFSNTYENYFIMLFITSNVNDAMWMRMRVSGADNTGANYYSQNLEASATSISAARLGGQTAWRPTNVKTDSQGSNAMITMFRPYAAASTNFFNNNYDPSSGCVISIWNGTHAVATSYDGFTLYPNSGAFSGNIRVYGYKNS